MCDVMLLLVMMMMLLLVMMMLLGSPAQAVASVILCLGRLVRLFRCPPCAWSMGGT